MALSTGLAAFGLFIIALPHFTGDQHYLVNVLFYFISNLVNVESNHGGQVV